jgi:hypothetical protein
MHLTLYYAPVSCSLVTYITLTEAGANFSVRPLNFGRGEHYNPEFLRINPRHRVPVLLIDDQPLLETLAIQLWAARANNCSRTTGLRSNCSPVAAGSLIISLRGMRISSGAFAAAGSLASTLARSISAWRISIA